MGLQAVTVKYLRTTRRRTTPSLLAQISLAIIALFFTFFSSYTQPSDNGEPPFHASLQGCAVRTNVDEFKAKLT